MGSRIRNWKQISNETIWSSFHSFYQSTRTWLNQSEKSTDNFVQEKTFVSKKKKRRKIQFRFIALPFFIFVCHKKFIQLLSFEFQFVIVIFVNCIRIGYRIILCGQELFECHHSGLCLYVRIRYWFRSTQSVCETRQYAFQKKKEKKICLMRKNKFMEDSHTYRPWMPDGGCGLFPPKPPPWCCGGG